MRMRGLCSSPGVRLSVCLSVTFVYRIKMAGESNFFPGLVAHHSGFLTPFADTQFQGEPRQRGAQNTGGWENFAIFD